MPWYHLSTDQQRSISQVLHGIQNGHNLTIGPFSELNFETASDVMHCIYCKNQLKIWRIINLSLSVSDYKENLYISDDDVANAERIRYWYE